MPGNVLVQMCQVTAKIAKKNLEVVIDTDEDRKAPAYKALNPTNKFPLLETPEGNLSESHAIAKFLAHGHATLLGSNPVERAQIDQWMNWLQSGVQQQAGGAIYAILGRNPDMTQPMFNEAVQGIKQNLRAVDTALSGDWIVGNSVSLADIFLAGTMSLPFQLILDQGFTKAAPKACAWFGRVSSLPEFTAIFGKIKIAKKSVKPVLKVEEKKKPAQQAAAAEKKPAEEKKAGNPLDNLPPTNFVIYDFKTLFVNLPDKVEAGHETMMKMVDREGWSFWFLHYDKFGEEGKVGYKFQNLLEGFIQRLEGFKKYSFGKFCMLGEEPSLEIQGILLIRGHDINVQELKDHPQMEYMQARKCDLGNAGDLKKIKEFFGSKDNGTCNDMKVQISMWHK